MKKALLFVLVAVTLLFTSCGEAYYTVDDSVIGFDTDKFYFRFENSETEKYDNIKKDKNVADAINLIIKLQSKHNPDYGYIDVSVNTGDFEATQDFFAALNYSNIFIFTISGSCNTSLEIKYEDIDMQALRDLSNDENVVSITIAESLLATE